jgi:hypothetical protein
VDLLHLNAGTTAKGGWGDVDYFHKVCQMLKISSEQ